jgi:hypothetical protein
VKVSEKRITKRCKNKKQQEKAYPCESANELMDFCKLMVDFTFIVLLRGFWLQQAIEVYQIFGGFGI